MKLGLWTVLDTERQVRSVSCGTFLWNLQESVRSSLLFSLLPILQYHPFTHTGLNFAGSLFIQDGKSIELQKVYICLFTYASTHGIHLELTDSLEVRSFLLALSRFSAQCGMVATLVSDNAKSFKAASKEVCKITRSTEVSHYLTNNRITWNFIAEKTL